ncbi:helix-turn-helix domain-containing protein [Paraburkholderia sp. BL21I4N1]|uniref:helix-turn-helix domain-containing protein n=1 Tax=Paraburkholderia sp. BL21I4N1 TaxID=1938801 RepID=UPI000CFB1EAB|nr:helix-turn-helix transcriptional regulator [Paraburkholderia sp. BL21I4N1]PQV50667.1 helix-turn-helix protein [Paraburkholderia sp. BL21I4N1]
MKLTPFGLYVRKLRLDLGLTLKTMADALAVSSAYLSSIELGDKQLTAKIAEDAVEFFQGRIGSNQIEELREAVARSVDIVPVSSLDSDEKVLVAAFARRLTEGAGVPNEVMNWLKREGKHGRSK